MTQTLAQPATVSPLAPAPHAPGPAGWPLVGVVPQLAADSLGFLTHVAREYGDVARLPLGTRPTYLLSSPADIEYVHLHTGREFNKGYGTDPFLGNGLVNSEGGFWRRQRRLAQPAFHRERIAAYAGMMTERTAWLLATWRGGERRDAHADMMRLTLGIVTETLFGADVETEAATIGEAVSTGITALTRETMRIIPLPRQLPTPTRVRMRHAAATLDRVIGKMIAARRAEGGDHGDLLSMFLAARDDDGSGMTDAQLRDEAMTMFLAGHETTANALTWTWMLLSRYPGVEASLLTELHTVLGGRVPTLADAPRLRYTDAVIKEAMRLYPPVPLVARQPINDTVIGGYHIPAGSDLWMSQWVTQRDPRFWPDPEAFDPTRWLNGSGDAAPPFAYFPFGGGPRKCIGVTFAAMEAVLVLATIAQRFALRVQGPVTVEATVFTARPKGGLPVQIVARA